MNSRGCEQMVEINIDFDELIMAFENGNLDNHFFINLEKNEIVNINENIDMNYSDRLDELDNDIDRYLPIPSDFQWNEKTLMETFAYGLENLDIIDVFIDTLQRRKPFKNFKLLLDKFNLREKWYDYREREVKNELINWLIESEIELVGQEEKMVKGFEIKELSPEEMAKLNDEIKSLSPIVCTNCDYRGNFNKRLFSITFEPENKLDFIQVKAIMEKRFKVTNFGTIVGDQEAFLTVAKCPKCDSEDIFWDF